LVALAAEALGPGYDVEILEAHHRMKRDAPSGTALRWARRWRGARHDFERSSRSTTGTASGPRAPGSIGFSVVRAGDIVGEHTVLFAAEGERIEITHRATDRLNFRPRCAQAAEWLIGRPAGLYRMEDVLGL
jgi:4-hydroxy-tetrahydrodipicolinate reductase